MVAKIFRDPEQAQLMKVEANVGAYARSDVRSYQTKLNTNPLNGNANHYPHRYGYATFLHVVLVCLSAQLSVTLIPLKGCLRPNVAMFFSNNCNHDVVLSKSRYYMFVAIYLSNIVRGYPHNIAEAKFS